MQAVVEWSTRIRRLYGVTREGDLYAAVLTQSAIGLVLLVVMGPFGTFHYFETIISHVSFWGVAVCLSLLVGFLFCKISLCTNFLPLKLFWLVLSLFIYAVIWCYFLRPSLVSHVSGQVSPFYCFVACIGRGIIVHLLICFPLIGGALGWKLRVNQVSANPTMLKQSGTIECCPSLNAEKSQELELQEDNVDSCQEDVLSKSSGFSVDDTVVIETRRCMQELGGDVICASAEDHYVRLHSAKKSKLIAGRFRDITSILEYLGVRGMQVHRSWWVTASAVSDRINDGGATVLVLICGKKIPVSRKYLLSVESVLKSDP